ncbi:hypothetical protein BDW22DRAFT_1359781 [Trametopsis cervina]|nr:hypothetical protein BDW22DRAFT_1359781 [Trametopsis cervina]
MAHLLNNPFQKPFEFPRPGPLLTPPETEPEYQAQGSHLSTSITNGLGIELEPSYRAVSATEVPISRKLQYIHSGPREARERTVQRSVRWLVVVTPPLSFAQEHGHFGHTLSVGSPSRLSQGVLMPLYQTMSSQLTAIAREFAFPSTSGLCLYLHTSHGGFQLNPRITDESWPLLWGHLFEPRSPTASGIPQLPIGGRIEFDIDLGKARWWDAWLGLARRENVDVPVSVAPSRRESLSHFREDSRSTFPDDQTEEPLDGASIHIPPRPSRTPGHRHVPRKLSLLDRLEYSSTRSGSRLVPRNATSPSPPAYIGLPPRSAGGLSPIVQESEPKTARKDIDTYVNSWRASASVAPTPLAASGQTSLNPANLPNDISITGDGDEESELDLNDFQWSVSSVGPPDYEYEDDYDTRSLESWRLPSVHLDRRAEGSVCLTPATCTSFGPPDWDEVDVYEDNFLSLAMAALVPSPDIAARMLEDSPPTPSTATSWGPPLEWPPSPVHSELSYVGSVDIGQRCMSEVPLTPSTATSWGPPLSWPATPATPYHVHTPDIGQRTFDLDAPRLNPAPRPRSSPVDAETEPWQNVWPYIGAAAAASSSSVPGTAASPYTFVFPQRPATTSVEPAEPQQTPQPSTPFAFGWPFFDVSTDAPAIAVQPPPEREIEAFEPEESGELDRPARQRKMSPFTFVFTSEPGTSSIRRTAGSSTQMAARESSPNEETTSSTESGPWTHVWPYAPSTEPPPVVSTGGPWSLVWPFMEQRSEVQSVISYPYFNLYPAVYPNFDIYPSLTGIVDHRAPTELSVYLAPSYPNVQPYRSVYPHLEIYPGAPMQMSHTASVSSSVERSYYPAIDIYGPVYPSDVSMYPWNVYNVYPRIEGASQERLPNIQVLTLTPGYPTLSLYAPVYPHNLEMIYPPVSGGASLATGLTTRLEAAYPYIEIYSPGYPFNLEFIYPPVKLDTQSVATELFSTRLNTRYPYIEIYSPVYPFNMESIYPPVKINTQSIATETSSIRLSAGYPHIEIYSPVYPYSVEVIYPTITVESYASSLSRSEKVNGYRGFKSELAYEYPSLVIYRAVYPYNVEEIYPPAPAAKQIKPQHASEATGSVVRLPAYYPTLEIYPAVYPWNLTNIYPSVQVDKVDNLLVLQYATQYPHVQPYRPVYPYNLENIYPPIKVSQREIQRVHAVTRSKMSSASTHGVHKAHHLSHVKRSSGSSRGTVPPVPPLPRNVHSLPPIHPTSHKPLSGRVGLSLPVRLPTSYPRFCLYPSVYPYLEIYAPRVADELASPQSQGDLTTEGMQRSISGSAAEKFLGLAPSFAPRRQPKYTHNDLHLKVFAVSPPVSPRRLPIPPQLSVPPAYQPSPPLTPPRLTSNEAPSPTTSPMTPPRARSGTITYRPPLPSPPVSQSPTHASPGAMGSPVKAARKLPPIPPHAHPRGLPSDPAVNRRASMLPVPSKPPPFSPLPSVPEPESMTSDKFPSPVTPPSSSDEAYELSRSASARVGTLSTQENVPQGLSRANSLPGKPSPRARRGTVTAPSGIVAGLAKAYNSNDESTLGMPPTSLSSTLAHFPTPPRPPLPPLPNSRPVSKLDRTRYPYH